MPICDRCGALVVGQSLDDHYRECQAPRPRPEASSGPPDRPRRKRNRASGKAQRGEATPPAVEPVAPVKPSPKPGFTVLGRPGRRARPETRGDDASPNHCSRCGTTLLGQAKFPTRSGGAGVRFLCTTCHQTTDSG